MHKQPFLLFAVLIAGLAILWSVVPPPRGLNSGLTLTQAQTSGDKELFGYAWSSNIGWVSFKGVATNNQSYGVKLTTTDALTGYAWSSNIGWIKFGGLTGCPGDGNCDAKLSGQTVVGWARACAAAGAGCLGSNPDSEGWDGWIKLSGVAGDGSSYGVVKVDHPNGDSSFQGFAWGGSVIGWLDFSVDGDAGSCDPVREVCLPRVVFDLGCSANNNAPTVTLIDGQATVQWTATVVGTNGPFDYVWSGDVSGNMEDTPQTSFTVPKTYDTVGIKTGTVTVTDSYSPTPHVDDCTTQIRVIPETVEPPGDAGGDLKVIGDGVIEIRNQASGQPAATIDEPGKLFVELKNEAANPANEGTLTNIRVVSIESQRTDNQDLLTVLGEQPKCQWESVNVNTTPHFVRCDTASVGSLASGQSAYFRLQLPKPLRAIAEHNPYLITIEATAGEGTVTAELIFDYLVGTFDPV